MTDTAGYPEFLVSTEWLARHLDDPRVRVLDPTTLLIPTPDYSRYDTVPARADFEKGHVPGAAFVDVQAELSTPDAHLRFMLPDAQTLVIPFRGRSRTLITRWASIGSLQLAFPPPGAFWWSVIPRKTMCFES